MTHFNRSFTTPKGVFKLFFTKVEGCDKPKFFVSVEAYGMQVAAFDMKQNKLGEWEVVEPAPSCIVEATTTLSNLIEEYNLQLRSS